MNGPMGEGRDRATVVLVFIGGERGGPGGGPPLLPTEFADRPDDVVAIAADSGLELALELGWRVDLAVGDFDSVAPEVLERALARGTVVERHPIDKDATDLELALDAALAHRPGRIVVAGGHGGRLDHLLGNALLLGAEAYRDVEIDAYAGPASLHVVRDERTLVGTPGELLTLLPLHGRAVGVTTAGLRYPLADEPLEPGSSRGLSNQFVASRATVTLRSGTLLAVRPGAPGPVD